MTSAPTRFVGTLSDVYGTAYGDVLVDLLEQVPDLHFPTSVRTYRQMSLYPQLRGVLAAYTLPIRRADWRVDPAGCRPEVAQLVADDLGLPLLGADPQPGSARRRGVSWAGHLRLAALGHLVYGFYPFEKRYAVEGGRQRLVELGERVPSSVVDVKANADGSLKGLRQNTMPNADDLIPADRLVWYAHEREGANWLGRSMLRSSYGAWLIVHEMWRVAATSLQRTGMGVPGFEPESGTSVTPAQMAEAQRIASSVRVGETSGYAAPPGFRFTLKGIEGSVPDPMAFIRYLDQVMATSALAGVLDLGSTPNGSRALGEVFVDLLLFAVQAVGDDMAAEATRGLAVPSVDFNFGEDEPAPRIVCGDVGASREVTAEALQALVSSGALSVDPELEAFVRSRYGLPDRAPAAPPVPARSAQPAAVPVAAAAGKRFELRREPTPVEAAAKTDFGRVQRQWQTAVDNLASEWGPVTDAQLADLVRQVEAAVRAGDIQALSRLQVDSQEAADLLESAMLDAADEAARTQADEADAQGVTVDPGSPDAVRIAAQAAALAAMLGSGLAIAAGRKAMQAFTPDATPAEVSAAVSQYVGSLTDGSLRDTLGAGLSFGQSAGRIATLQAAPAAARYAASEILDSSTCEACAAEDGHEFADLAEAEAAYASGGFTGCQGGLRCRGIIVTLWDDAGLEQAA